jgi:hypothetical protein
MIDSTSAIDNGDREGLIKVTVMMNRLSQLVRSRMLNVCVCVLIFFSQTSEKRSEMGNI